MFISQVSFGYLCHHPLPDKKKLPEISVSSGPIVQHAREMADIRAKIAVLKTQEETACQKIKAAAEPMRQARIDGDDDPRFVGMIRIVANGLTPVRCEFKLTKNTALELTEEKRLTPIPRRNDLEKEYQASEHRFYRISKVLGIYRMMLQQWVENKYYKIIYEGKYSTPCTVFLTVKNSVYRFSNVQKMGSNFDYLQGNFMEEKIGSAEATKIYPYPREFCTFPKVHT
jgi:hypothetical protein